MKIWKAKELIEFIESDGWYEVRQKGSHKHFRHPFKRGIVTIPYSGNHDIPTGTANSILKQAGLTNFEFHGKDYSDSRGNR
jgi:predicted RNA binding protein YcfA (HicA-like mRNA interferase family)